MRILLFFDARAVSSGHLKSLPERLRSRIVTATIEVPVFGFFSVPQGFHASSNFELHRIVVLRDGQAIERPPAREEYVKLFGGGENYETYLTALQILNRLDLTGTLRFVDREALVRLAIQRILDYLCRESSAVAVFPTTPHTFFDYLAFSLCKFLGIPTLFFQPVPFAPLMIPHTDLGEQKIPSRGRAGDASDISGCFDLLGRNLETLLDGGQPNYMERQSTSALRATSPAGRWRAIVQTLSWLRTPRFPESLDFVGSSIFNSALKPILVLLLSRGLEFGLRERVRKISPFASLSGDFALFALHYEPERTSVPEGHPILSQIDAIAIARSILPQDTTLVVKEHRSQDSPALRGFAGRSQFFYEFVSNLSNTMLIGPGPGPDTTELVSSAQCVFTLTGTIGIEAASRGIPVGHFGSPWWQGLPGTVKLSGASHFDEISKLPRSNIEDTILGLMQMTREKAILGICSEEPADYQQRNGPVEEIFWDLSVQAVCNEILDICEGAS